ncbi:unnamed protein product [Caenorhabditis bovis]|uniref:Protein quiver n=1 Tax=Caenorhabditis bovis TaxID=2654633 RepID=A0A8S1EXE1_9PELO|nr:unnamed protein product [Caenorhabditis bovis]
MFRKLLFLAIFCAFNSADGLKCHKCGGTDGIPKAAKSLISKLNITTLDSLYGDCKAKSGSDMCDDGKFCLKSSHVYEVSYGGVSAKWTSYTKGCATQRKDNQLDPTATCYDLGLVGDHSGYTVRNIDCYCDKEFCNSSQLLSIISSSALIAIIYLLKF